VSFVLALLVLISILQAQPLRTAEAKITVEADKPGHKISPTLFGIFFEDINNSTDSGIYPKLIRNRSFNGE
jgi:hypothetical protein